MQVPVINKTDSLFVRNPDNPTQVTQNVACDFNMLLQQERCITTIKTDGTCGILCQDDGAYYIMRRQDIKPSSRNCDQVLQRGKLGYFAGHQCFITQITRGTGKMERIVPFYIFQLCDTPNGIQPEWEAGHLVGFTPLTHTIPEDKHVATAYVGTNGTSNLELYCTVFDGNLDIPIRLLPASEILSSKTLISVEIMGPTIAKRYGFTKSSRHFINPHGSIVCPDNMAPEITYDGIRTWFENLSINRWADNEGLVFHFPIAGRRFKVHRGHLGLKTWSKQSSCGINFIDN